MRENQEIIGRLGPSIINKIKSLKTPIIGKYDLVGKGITSPGRINCFCLLENIREMSDIEYDYCFIV